jgi:phosphohistidine phosphatase
MTIELGILRHADAGDPYAWTGDDAARPLSKKGRRQAERLGAFLAGLGYGPDVLIASPKLRARETAEIVAAAVASRLTIDARLAGGFDLHDLAETLSEAGDPGRPFIVGHDPDFSILLGELCGARDIPLRKGALARVDLEVVAAGAGRLRWLIPPDALKGSG